MSRCLGGDSRAWNQLINRYSRLVHSVPVRYGLSTAEPDDVGQEVFLALAQACTPSTPRATACTLAADRRTAHHLARRAAPQGQYPLDDEPDNPETGPADHTLLTTPSMETLLHGWQLQTWLRNGLLKLGDRCRELITTIFSTPANPATTRSAPAWDCLKAASAQHATAVSSNYARFWKGSAFQPIGPAPMA